jgi:hypothetical protein
MRIILATSVALSLCAAALAAAPTAPPAAAPDLSGFWVRTGNLLFDPILDDD